VWMGLALGPVLSKMGMLSKRAWIPVLRWAAAAEAGRTSRVAVLIARSVSTLGVAILLVALALRGLQGEDVTVAVAVMTLVGVVLFWIGAFVGWIFWIVAAGTIGLRLNIARGWTALAALSPSLWAAIVGWANVGTPIPSDVIGRAASAGAGARSSTDSQTPADAPVATAAAISIFGAGREPVEPATAGFNTARFNSETSWPVSATAPRPAPEANVPDRSEPAASPEPVVSPAPASSPLPAATPGDKPEHAAPEAVSPPPAPAESLPPAPLRPSPYASRPAVLPAALPDREALASGQFPAAPPAADPTRPVSPYIAGSMAGLPEGLGATLGAPGAQRPEPEDDETVVEKMAAAQLAKLPPGWGQTPEATPAEEAQASPRTDVAADPPASLAAMPPESPAPPVPAQPAARVEPPAPLEPTPPPAPAEPTAPTQPTSQVEPPTPLDPTPPPTRPAPVGVWAAPSTAPSAEVPTTASAPLAPPEGEATRDDREDDHTVMTHRRREVWVLEVTGGDSYPLPEAEVTIGRIAANISGTSRLGIDDDTRTMSKTHAKLRLVDGAWQVSDLGSTNGTFVRDGDGREVEVAPGTEAIVDGTLLLGDLEASIVNHGSGAA